MCIGSKSFPLFCPYRDGIIWLKVLVLGTANSCKQLQMGAFWNGWYCLVLGLWGSSPVSSTKRLSENCLRLYAGIAHLVERHLAKVEVASSSLVARSKKQYLPLGAAFFIHRANLRPFYF